MSSEDIQDIVDWASCSLGLGSFRFRGYLKKGGSSDIILLQSTEASKKKEMVIVRRYRNRDWLAREPHLPANETRMTQFAHDAGLPAPQILGSRVSSTPLVAMSAVEGKPLGLSNVDRKRLESAANMALEIHSLQPPDPLSETNLYSPHYLRTAITPQCPKWSRNPTVWNLAIDLYKTFEVSPQRALLHRDFHFGNLMFTDEKLTSVVDWVTSCFGDPQADVAHMRWNLMLSHGPDAVAIFTSTYYRGVIGKYDPVWDIYALAGALPDINTIQAAGASKLDQLMENAVSSLDLR